MALDFISISAGAPKDAAPHFVGEILQNFLLKSNEPFARAFRKYLTSVDADMEALLDNELFKTLFPNTELSVDLKLLTRVAGRMAIGEVLPGDIVRDGEYHFTFMENAPKPKETKVGSTKRNPHDYVGDYITITHRDDDSLRLNFREIKVDEDFNVEAYAIAVANEIILGLKGPVKEKPGE